MSVFVKVTGNTGVYKYGHTVYVHDALPICRRGGAAATAGARARVTSGAGPRHARIPPSTLRRSAAAASAPSKGIIDMPAHQSRPSVHSTKGIDRKSTRLNSSH